MNGFLVACWIYGRKGLRLHIPSLHGKQMGNNGNSDRTYFLGLQKSLQMVTAPKKLKDTCSLEEKL